MIFVKMQNLSLNLWWYVIFNSIPYGGSCFINKTFFFFQSRQHFVTFNFYPEDTS